MSRDVLLRILRNAAVFAVLFFAALFAADRTFPGLFSRPVEWWLLPVLFVAHALTFLVRAAVRGGGGGPRA